MKEVKEIKGGDFVMVPAKVVGIYKTEGLGTDIKLSLESKNGHYFIYVDGDELHTPEIGYPFINYAPVVAYWQPSFDPYLIRKEE